MNIITHIREQASLAETYAEDGAFHSAARRLRWLADDVQRHADQADALVKATIDDADSKGGA